MNAEVHGSTRETAPPDPWALYALMKRSRVYEDAVTRLWQQGLISGEMHLGTGEEAVIAGVVSQLRQDDAMAVDHRGTAAFLMRGVDPVALLREMLGRPDGLCRGQGGHMHLFCKELLSASSGIVGAEGPAAAGFALAARHLRPGSLAVAFFGDGAMNQGMLLESFNLAAVWRLPVLFVCKDDGWAITTRPEASTAGSLQQRVEGLGVRYVEADGLDVGQVCRVAGEALAQARAGGGPAFLHAHCIHLEGHFLGLQLLRVVRHPFRELPGIVAQLGGAGLRPGGGSAGERGAGLGSVIAALRATLRDPRQRAANDPLVRAREALEAGAGQEPGAEVAVVTAGERLADLDRRIEAEVAAMVAAALQEPSA
jgi:TPP-dependent pyruvate/acetoin dehydrogenase alpha subunit